MTDSFDIFLFNLFGSAGISSRRVRHPPEAVFTRCFLKNVANADDSLVASHPHCARDVEISR